MIFLFTVFFLMGIRADMLEDHELGTPQIQQIIEYVRVKVRRHSIAMLLVFAYVYVALICA